MPTALTAVTTTWCLPYLYVFLNGDVHGLSRFPSTAQVNVAPGVVLVNLILAWRLLDRFFGALVTVVSGAGQAAWVRPDCGHRSWETSPKVSPSTSGSRTAEMSGR